MIVPDLHCFNLVSDLVGVRYMCMLLLAAVLTAACSEVQLVPSEQQRILACKLPVIGRGFAYAWGVMTCIVAQPLATLLAKHFV